MRLRAALKRVLGIFVPVLVGAFGAACSNDFDSSRNVPVRGTLGAELFGVVCDCVGGQSLHEDLTGRVLRRHLSPAGQRHLRRHGGPD